MYDSFADSDPFPALTALSVAARAAAAQDMPDDYPIFPRQTAPSSASPTESAPTDSLQLPTHATVSAVSANRGGRPRLLNPDKKEQFCQLLRIGAPRGAAARVLGMTAQTVRNAIRHDPDFAARAQEAEHACERRALLNIDSVARNSWRASAWLLEHRRGSRYKPYRPGVRAVLRSKEFRAALLRLIEKRPSSSAAPAEPKKPRTDPRSAALVAEIHSRQARGEHVDKLALYYEYFPEHKQKNSSDD
jgi:hypothetical protein